MTTAQKYMLGGAAIAAVVFYFSRRASAAEPSGPVDFLGNKKNPFDRNSGFMGDRATGGIVPPDRRIPDGSPLELDPPPIIIQRAGTVYAKSSYTGTRYGDSSLANTGGFSPSGTSTGSFSGPAGSVGGLGAVDSSTRARIAEREAPPRY